MYWKGTKGGLKVFLDLPSGRIELFQTEMDSSIGRVHLRGRTGAWF